MMLISLILLSVVLVVYTAFYIYIHLNYSNFNGEYSQSSTSSHLYQITDISLERYSKILNVDVIKDNIHILYLNTQENSLKLAIAKTLKPQFLKDWEISTVSRKFISYPDRFSTTYSTNTKLINTDFVNSYTVSYRLIKNNPCITYTYADSYDKPTLHIIGILQAKVSNPKSPIEWVHYKQEIKDTSDFSRLSFGLKNSKYLILVTRNARRKASDEVKLFIYDPETNEWDEKPILRFKPDDNIYCDATIISDPKQLIILYHQIDGKIKKPPGSIHILSIPDIKKVDKSTWIDSEINYGYYKFAFTRLSNQVIRDSASGTIYFAIQIGALNYDLMSFNVINGVPKNIKETNFSGQYRNQQKKIEDGPLKNILNYRKLQLLNQKPVFTSVLLGSLTRFDIDPTLKPITINFQKINFFNKINSTFNEIFPIPLNNGLSYVYYQPNLGKIRLAREVDPKDVPKKSMWNIFSASGN